MRRSDIKYMTEAIAAELAELLSKNYNVGVPEALDILYNSETYAKLCNPDTGLYFQSALYVYSFLNEELSYGRL